MGMQSNTRLIVFPPPIVSDLNGNGKKEILVATHDAKIQEYFPHNAHHREIAISISNYTLKHEDSGLVIIGGRMEMQPRIYLDPFEEIGLAEKNAEEHRRSASEKEPSENSGTVDLRHFALYAFAGQTGALRWSRKNENIEAQSSDAASQVIPQHNYKLDVNALNSRHPGEFECREFRESILGVMPHHWDRREDTVLQLLHFRRHKRKTSKKSNGKTTSYPFHKPEENHPPGKDSTKKNSNLIGEAAKYAGSTKSKKPSQYIPTITNYTLLWWLPNVVVAHQKEGIEAIHLVSGCALCKQLLTNLMNVIAFIGFIFKKVASMSISMVMES